MRKVIGIGETILDILFKNNQPTVAVPGGSVFNGLVSLGRAGANVTFISEVGGDRVGDIILNFMKENGRQCKGLSRPKVTCVVGVPQREERCGVFFL